MIKGVKIVTIPVADQNRALAFYTGKLGFRVDTDQPFEGGQRWIELGIPGCPTKVALFTPKGQEDRVGTFAPCTLWTDDVHGTYEDLKAKGVEFTTPPTKQSWGEFTMFKDSEGNSFVLGSR